MPKGFDAIRGTTFDTPDTPPGTRVSEVSEVTPALAQATVCHLVGFSESSWHRYHREYRNAVICGEDKEGRHLCAPANVEFFRQIKTAKNQRMRTGIAEAQRERLAQLAAGRPLPEVQDIYRELRQWAEHQHRVSARVGRLLERRPELRRAPMERRVTQYYAAYHPEHPRIADLASGALPKWSTVERAFRRHR